MNLYPVTLIDNFYEDPAAIREFALAQNYQFRHELPEVNYVFPGCRTQDLSVLNPALFEKICKKLVSVFHNHEHDYMRWAITSSFQSVSATYGSGVIHQDSNTVFAGVLYLSPDAPLNAGTSLYKPNATFNAARYDQSLKDNDKRFAQGELVMSTDYHSMFDEVVRVNNIYNSLIIYEGDTYHAANQFFGEDLQNSRLAQVFFISKVEAQKQSVFPLSRVKAFNV
jgi:hypothetical protein